MLVRGMFVDVTVKAAPKTQLLLVPKLSIKPATDSSVIWKFTENRDVIRKSPKAIEAIQAYEQAKRAGTAAELYADDAESEQVRPANANRIDPERWAAGNLQIVNDVRMVTAYWGEADTEYWVCEVPANQLSPGDQVIVSPLPGVKADGSDSVRVRRDSVPANLADFNRDGGRTDARHEG
jgi:hypothetical protein